MSTTQKPVLPAALELEIVAKWLEEKQHKFTLRLKNTATGQDMRFPYSGGCLAFLPKETPQNKTRLAEIRKGLAIRVRTLWDEEQFNTALNLAHSLAKPDLAGVLHSLLCDMDAGEGTFKDFCDNYGYDTDSRKAYKT